MPDLKDSRVLVTGGAGLVGSHLCDQLIDEGVAEIVVIDNFTRGRRSNLADALTSGKVRIVEGDIRDSALLAKTMDGIDIVFHQAAIRITQCAEQPRLAFEVLAAGTFNVLEAAVNAKVTKVVAASSASVYGMAEVFPTTEAHHPYGNRTIYGASKTYLEGLFRSFNEMYGLKYVGLRYFNIYGPRMDIHGVYTEVLIRWMNAIVEGKSPVIFGNGQQTMDFIYITDVARSNILAGKSEVSDEIFNIASGTETSLIELAQCLLEVMNSNLPVQYQPERSVNSVQRRLADVSLSTEKLGFHAMVPLRVGLKQLVDWWSKERAAKQIHA